MTRLTRPLVSTIALSLAGVTTQAALADDATLDFGVPAWPGITVKTEIAEQLLNPLGYDTQTHEIGLQVIYQGMESGDVDAFLGAWLPAQKRCSNRAKPLACLPMSPTTSMALR
ncbi:hypothetical protein HAALTHF_26910n [Vreelandella aquamarina]|nr:hypothetical protein HAALTHF_26910n [Halomonas axialensis]